VGMPERLALIQLKKHLAWYTSGLDGSAAIRRAIYEASDRNAVRQLFAECWSNTRNTGSGTGWLRTETSGSSARQ
jgi:tRNA-dihydrouridine synthase